jgi:hypothetical protein
MLALQPGMVSKICESFKGLYLMVAESFYDARTEGQPLTRMAESDTRLKNSVSAPGGLSSKIPPASESIRSTTFCHVTGNASQPLKASSRQQLWGSLRTRRTASPRLRPGLVVILAPASPPIIGLMHRTIERLGAIPAGHPERIVLVAPQSH